MIKVTEVSSYDIFVSNDELSKVRDCQQTINEIINILCDHDCESMEAIEDYDTYAIDLEELEVVNDVLMRFLDHEYTKIC